MNKIFSNVMLVAAAAMTLFGCQKQEIAAPEYKSVDALVFGSGKPVFNDETKTEWTGEIIKWSKGDKIRVAYTCDGVWQNADGTATGDEENGSKTAKLYASDALAAAEEISTFVVPGTFKGKVAGVYQFYGLYPSTLTSSTDLKYAPSVAIEIPSEQTPVANSFDAEADVMVAQSDLYDGMPIEGEKNGSISLEWKRLVAHAHITLKDLQVDGQEIVKSIILTANTEADMVGKHNINFMTHVVDKVGETATNSIIINGKNLTIDDKGNVTFWACFLPCTWTSISVRVETDKATYALERDLLALNNTKTFAKNARNLLSINMSEASREVRVSALLPFVKDFSNMSGSTAINSLEGFSSVEGKVYNANAAIRLASASEAGSITTQLLDLSQNFHVKVTASGWDSDELSLNVSTSDNQNATVALTTYGTSSTVGQFTEHIVNFQPVSSSATVTFKAVGGVRCHIQKIEILEGHAALIPVLTALTPSEIRSEGGAGEFTYTLTNPIDGQKVSATSNVDWITDVDVIDGKVTYTVAENTSDTVRSGDITLNYKDVEPINVTITQAGKSSAEVNEETVIYETAFNYAIEGSAYNSANEIVGSDQAGTSWGITYGNWNGSNCAQLRVYSAAKFGSIYMKFDVANATRVSYKAKVSNTALKLNTYYSTDSGATWTKVNSAKALTTTLTVYEFTISDSGEYSKVRVKFEAAGTAPSSSNYQLTVDDVVIYGFKNSGGETPEPEEPETPEEPEQPTLSSRNLTFSLATATATMGQAFTPPTLSGVTTGVTYSSSNTSVATVNASTGAITLVGAGTTVITASAPASDNYEADSATYSLTVNAASTSTKKTYTLTITPDSFNGSSYANNNNEKTSIATASDGTTMEVKWTSYQVMLQSSVMQWQKSKGYIYNSTDLGIIKDITVTSTEGTFTNYIGTSQKPTASGNGGYFQIKVGSALGKTSKVVITFEK